MQKTPPPVLFLASTLCVFIGLSACGESEEQFVLPPGFPSPVIPSDNPVSPEKAELGRHLFYEKRLSGNGTQACSSCHEQARAFTDGLVTPLGSTGESHPRNSQSLTNVAYNASLTWANPVLTQLEQQALIPIFGEHPIELGALTHEDEILGRLESDPLYVDLFGAAFPGTDTPFTWDNVVAALATFQRTLISGNSPFDQFTYQGNKSALSPAQKRGMELFFAERLECHHCHSGFNFTESTVHENSRFDALLFHNNGLYNIDGNGGYPANNTGLHDITGNPEDMGKFRPPTLRNIAVTAPYMHDGSIETLEEVIRMYERGGRLIEEGPYAGDGSTSPLRSGLVAGFSLTDQERDDLIQFLHSLTDNTFLENEAFSNPFSESMP